MPNGFQAVSTIQINTPGQATRIADYRQHGMRSAKGRDYAKQDRRVKPLPASGSQIAKGSVVNDYSPRKNPRKIMTPAERQAYYGSAKGKKAVRKGMQMRSAGLHPGGKNPQHWGHGFGRKKHNVGSITHRSDEMIKKNLKSTRISNAAKKRKVGASKKNSSFK